MIDYSLLAQSIEYYDSFGFKRIESPWTVSSGIVSLTLPPGKVPYKIEHNKKCLVGSGEQSFLYLYNKGFLPKGKFQTITPCFRDDEFSTTHTKYFMKNELIITDEVNQERLNWMIHNCQMFFQLILAKTVDRIKTDIGYDLMVGNIELGSYGIRDFNFINYIYGTGLAEPRMSYCKNIK